MKKNIALITLLILPASFFSAWGQSDKPEIFTDRPDFSSTPMIIPKGSVQMETGFLFEKDKLAGIQQTNIAYNSTLVKYGVNENFEVGIALGYLGSCEYSEKSITKGFSPLSLGAKIKLADEKRFWPQAALISHVNFKTGSERFDPEFTATDIALAFSHTITNWWSITYNIGAVWNGESPEATFLYTFTSDFIVTKQLSFFAESYCFFPEMGKASHRMDAGFLYKLAPTIQFDISGGIGLSKNAPDYFLSTGLSIRLFK